MTDSSPCCLARAWVEIPQAFPDRDTAALSSVATSSPLVNCDSTTSTHPPHANTFPPFLPIVEPPIFIFQCLYLPGRPFFRLLAVRVESELAGVGLRPEHQQLRWSPQEGAHTHLRQLRNSSSSRIHRSLSLL